jgi:hypothetical protein
LLTYSILISPNIFLSTVFSDISETCNLYSSLKLRYYILQPYKQVADVLFSWKVDMITHVDWTITAISVIWFFRNFFFNLISTFFFQMLCETFPNNLLDNNFSVLLLILVLYVHVYKYMYMCVCVYIYIYIYIYLLLGHFPCWSVWEYLH